MIVVVWIKLDAGHLTGKISFVFMHCFLDSIRVVLQLFQNGRFFAFKCLFGEIRIGQFRAMQQSVFSFLSVIVVCIHV